MVRGVECQHITSRAPGAEEKNTCLPSGVTPDGSPVPSLSAAPVPSAACQNRPLSRTRREEQQTMPVLRPHRSEVCRGTERQLTGPLACEIPHPDVVSVDHRHAHSVRGHARMRVGPRGAPSGSSRPCRSTQTSVFAAGDVGRVYVREGSVGGHDEIRPLPATSSPAAAAPSPASHASPAGRGRTGRRAAFHRPCKPDARSGRSARGCRPASPPWTSPLRGRARPPARHRARPWR